MIVQEEEYERCGECGTMKTCTQQRIYGCDNCKRTINMALKDGNHQYLEVTVFYSSDASTKRLQFCSWKCVLARLPKVKSDHFITLPYLLFEGCAKGTHAKDFFAALKGRK